MSYQVNQGQGSIRTTVDSRDSYRGSFRPSVEGRDSCTAFGNQVVLDKIHIKLNEFDKTNGMIKSQLMGLAKISKDNKADNEKFSSEVVSKTKLSTKQKLQRIQKAEKREERHRAMRQGINDMFHE